MAKVSMNSALRELRGRVDEWVFNQYSYGTVVTRRPDMSKVRPSPAQLAHREKVRAAAAYYRAALKTPTLLKRLSAEARKRGISLSAVAPADYFKQGCPKSG